jgi:hypothetical protein
MCDGITLTNWGSPSPKLLPDSDWFGHRNIRHTVRYTELSPARFSNFLAGMGAGEFRDNDQLVRRDNHSRLTDRDNPIIRIIAGPR